jgi:hypothetical protein
MTKKTWQFELEDGKHQVELEHGFFSGKRNIQLDGKAIFESSEFQNLVFDTGGVHEFNVNSHPCAVIIRTNGLTFYYDFAVDGRSITTGKSIDSIKPLPAWVWLLIVGGISIGLCIAAIVGLWLII